MKLVVRTTGYLDDLDAIEAYIAKDSARAGADMWFHIDDQVAALADPHSPRRRGGVAGTVELVAHHYDIVILEEDEITVTALNVRGAASALARALLPHFILRGQRDARRRARRWGSAVRPGVGRIRPLMSRCVTVRRTTAQAARAGMQSKMVKECDPSVDYTIEPLP